MCYTKNYKEICKVREIDNGESYMEEFRTKWAVFWKEFGSGIPFEEIFEVKKQKYDLNEYRGK